MTTIAYKDGVIAYDSQATRGETIVNVPYDKKVEANGYQFFFAGSPMLFDTLVELFFTGEKSVKVDATMAFVVYPDGSVHIAGFDEEKDVVSDAVCDGEIYAIGSGADWAIGAMDAGMSAQEAVLVAAKRDPYTGGKIRTYSIGGGDE